MNSIYDDYLTASEVMLINRLKGKNRMEQDDIIGEYENG